MPEHSPAAESPDDLKEKIEIFLLNLRHGTVTEPGREVIDLSTSHYSLSTEYGKLLWHLWNERTNLVRQITAIRKERTGRMELQFQVFGKGPPGSLIVAESRAAEEQLARRSQRTRYAQTLKRFLAQLFPHWKLEHLSSEPNLGHSFSGVYTRGELVQGQQAWAVIGVGSQENPEAIEGILTYGLLWLDWLRQRDSRRVLAGLKIFVPVSHSSTTVQRLSWMDPNLSKWEVYETEDEVRRVDLGDFGNLNTSLAPAGGPFITSNSESIEHWVDRIRALSPDIELRLGTDNFPVLSIRGLAFAKQTARGVVFGVGRDETLLELNTFSELQKLIRKILRFRQWESQQSAAARAHPYYRLQPEKWMQSILIRQIDALGYDLAAEALYEQVPALSGTERGLMDLLAVNSHGRLVVVEFKASEDIHLALQALDYWMRVHWHQQRGELERQGYFPGRVLSSQPPLLLLVSPALQFHPACETVLQYFSPCVQAVRVGLNENWRERLQVVFRKGMPARASAHL